MKKFTKYDSGKPRVELVEPKFILGLAQVLTFGAEKYAKDNWKLMTVDDRDRVYGAMQRHLLAYWGGEKIDPESGMSHLYHASFGMMVLDYFDRVKQPNTPKSN